MTHAVRYEILGIDTHIAVGSLKCRRRAYTVGIASPTLYAVHFDDPTAIHMSFVGTFQNL
jgi:hypothetical protein